MRLRIGLLALVSALTAAGSAHAKPSLTFDRVAARPGDSVRASFGRSFTATRATLYVYLVHAPILGDVLRPEYGGGVVREGPPPRRGGVHRVGRTSTRATGLTFRVPAARPGRYAAVLWCPTCRASHLVSTFQGGIPDGAAVPRPRTLLRIGARA